MKAISLIRISTRRQASKGNSVSDQEDVVANYATTLNAQIIDVVRVQVSGSKMILAGGVLHKVMSQAKEQGAVIITTALDRISRDATTLFMLRKQAQESGVEVYIAGLNRTISSMNTMEFGVLSSYAEYERQLVSKRTTLATKKRSKGYAFGKADATESARKSIEKRRQIAKDWRKQIGLLDEVKSAIHLLKKPTLQRIAVILNGKGLVTIRGNQWNQPRLGEQIRSMGFKKWQEIVA